MQCILAKRMNLLLLCRNRKQFQLHIIRKLTYIRGGKLYRRLSVTIAESRKTLYFNDLVGLEIDSPQKSDILIT